jgi:lipopolysaccharide export LptBFGC system permease protein LptF
MKYQRGLALSSLIFWGVVVALVAILGLNVVPTTLEYYKVLKDTKATVNKVGPEASVADVRKTFDNFANIDGLDFKADQLNITKENGKIVASFDYEKRIPLFANVFLVINYKGSSAE